MRAPEVVKMVDVTAPAWLDELVLDAAPPAHHMGTRALDPARWLESQPGDDRLIEQKARVLRDHEADVYTVSPVAAPLVRDVVAVLSAGSTSLAEAALTTAEDVCVVAHHEGHWRLEAGVVCFPSMWRLPDKIGMSIADVHGPVPHYAEELSARVDRFLDRLQPERPVWRRNWFIHDTPELFLPRPPAPRPAVTVPDDLWLRSERQTLRRLDGLPVMLFTIRTDIAPLATVADRPDVAARMATAIVSWSDELVAYRAAGPWRDDVVAWLEALV